MVRKRGKVCDRHHILREGERVDCRMMPVRMAGGVRDVRSGT